MEKNINEHFNSTEYRLPIDIIDLGFDEDKNK